ncbi:MAG: crotonobetainyl-CoA:carnitine CoA-transferase CaiB-like acyl-CoA transferase [Candidatus Azotimanducaceae bacterium]|jgi:crotonobetainyl-CoA:carnitine CoA-transferase CaiB-like acyl-CoA transferase
MSEESLLFEGLKVLDVGSWIAGPVAGTMLADRGAEVLKIELPVIGDGYRNYAMFPFTPMSDVNYTWAMDARNKRSLSLNLTTDQGMQILHRLIEDCDVFLTNQPLSQRRAFRLQFDDIKSLNEKMIYASLTPYGELGPDSDDEAFDLVAYWNRSGLMNQMRKPGAEPRQAVAGMGDHPTAVAMYAAIVTALLLREKTGKGTMVHTSLLANGLWASSCLTQAQLAGADFSLMPPQWMTGALYETSDGRWIQISMVRTPEIMDTMLLTMGLDELLIDERFGSLEARAVNADAFTQLLRDRFLTRSSREWVALLREEAGLPINLVANFEDVASDPHLELNQMIAVPAEDIGIDRIINDPVNVEGVARLGALKAPDIGEHTNEVLQFMGFSPSEIDELRANGVI